MRAPARLITLNLGSQTIGLAEFRVAHGGLVLVNYRLREVPLDPETGQRRDAHVAFEEGAAVLRVYDAACNVIDTHEQAVEFKEP